MSFTRRTPLFALGLLASASSAAFVAHEVAGVVAASHVRSILARAPGVSAASVRADPWTGRITIEGLGAPGVAIGTLRRA